MHYKESYNKIKHHIYGSGVLKVNHLMGTMAIIGVLPLWYIEFYHGVHLTDGMKHIVEKFGVSKGIASTQSFMNSFAHALSSKFERKFSMRECENIICKVLREDKNTVDIWRDIVYLNQAIFEPYDDNIIIHRVIYDKENGLKRNEEKKLNGPLLK